MQRSDYEVGQCIWISFGRFPGHWPSVVRAHGGCLGADRRGRTWQAAKSHGEVHATFDPWMSEWGNPAGVIFRHLLGGANPGN
jgi:hypothetical protein